MKHSELTPLIAVESLKKLSAYDVLNSLIESDVEIYAINNYEKIIDYDYCEISHYSKHDIRTHLVEPDVEEKRFEQGKIIPVSKEVLFQLAINNSVNEAQLFSSDDQTHKISTDSVRDNFFKQMTYDDLYIHKDDLDNVTVLFKPKPKERSTRQKKEHIVAIEEAIEELGKTTPSKRIFSYIKKQAESGLMNLEFEGDDIQPFGPANSDDTVMKVKGSKITKKTVENICSAKRNEK